ncbi:Hypothetical protein CINCED_3A018967 [Cinara cedri]|uniref:Uncharacterized protein n=1 Tax=Cinara cedri TaxID=506608 RepID=A0A5E4M9F9_9HEMI|nr:Hypothetical protein CINCED_3A018967 [Cinara cedri]
MNKISSCNVLPAVSPKRNPERELFKSSNIKSYNSVHQKFLVKLIEKKEK